MPLLLPFLVTWLVTVGLLLAAGQLAERASRVREGLRRLDGLVPPLRGRLGVWIAKDPRVPVLARFLPLTAFVYGVTPLDLLPDVLPGVGRLDDRAVLAIALWAVTAVAPSRFEEHLARVEFLRDAALEQLSDDSAAEDASS